MRRPITSSSWSTGCTGGVRAIALLFFFWHSIVLFYAFLLLANCIIWCFGQFGGLEICCRAVCEEAAGESLRAS